MINVGDRVTVYFERVEAEYNVEIVRIPLRPHDSWELKRLDGVTVYVQQYSKMVVTKPAAGYPGAEVAGMAKESTGEGPNYPKKD